MHQKTTNTHTHQKPKQTAKTISKHQNPQNKQIQKKKKNPKQTPTKTPKTNTHQKPQTPIFAMKTSYNYKITFSVISDREA